MNVSALAAAALAAALLGGAAPAATGVPFEGYGYRWTSEDASVELDVHLLPGQAFADILRDPGLASLLIATQGQIAPVAGYRQEPSVEGTTVSFASVIGGDGYTAFTADGEGVCAYTSLRLLDLRFDVLGALAYTITERVEAPTHAYLDGRGPGDASLCPGGAREERQTVRLTGAWAAYGGAPPVPASLPQRAALARPVGEPASLPDR